VKYSAAASFLKPVSYGDLMSIGPFFLYIVGTKLEFDLIDCHANGANALSK
jgi:hypothetical protein